MFNFMRLPPLRRLMLMKAITGGGSWSTITGNPVSFTAKAAPLKQLQIAFAPVQSGSGDPSPDNVRPILGWDSLTVYHSGADTSDPQTISITIGQTVYGGTLDVLTGVVTVDKASVDLGSLTWSQESDHYYSSAISTAKTPPDNTTPANAICSNYINLARNNVYFQTTDMSVAISNTGRVYVYDSILAGKPREEFKSAMSGVQLVYELATPITIQLTPQEVESLAGDNVLFSDANGDLTVEYRSN